jgi:hypothetical protein
MGLSDLNTDTLNQNNYHRSTAQIGEDDKTAEPKTVVLWGSEDILISSVESILSSNKEWEVISLSNKVDIDALIQVVETTHANIIIMQQTGKSDPIFIPMQLLKDIPSLRVITVNLENNSMEVFSKQKILVKDVTDLMSIFEIESRPICLFEIIHLQKKGAQPPVNYQMT